jgi:6-pyruvoyltetrahydropterin/6-carboxytetrahydropterin synthase
MERGLLMTPTREVMIEMGFSSAHALRGYQGKCENTHGHNYKVEVYVRGKELNSIGLLIDFKDLKAATRTVVEYLDHKNINELPPFDKELNPSAEELAGYFFYEVGRQINNERVQVHKVRVWETDTCAATYSVD